LNDAIANYHKFSAAELPAKAPGIDWPAYWKALGAEPKYVVVGQPEFLAKAGRLLASEPMEEWKAYFRWHVLTSGAPLLHQAADAEDFGFFGTVLEGRQQQSPLWKRAILMVDGKIGDALGQAYAARYFPPAAKARMQEMVANIKTAYAGRIKTTAWMSPETRNRALEKLEKFRAKLGYPDKWKDYASLEIRRDDYYGNVQRSQLWESRRQLGRIGQPVDRDEWSMTPPTVNAYFNQNNNEIVFPAGILQPPFFDLAMDDAVNYGATGATIGHELTHGFDSEGRKFDSQGNLNDWWTKADSKEFERRAQRLVDQFSKLDGLPGLKVNGKLTLPENIADLGGVILAYEALQTSLAADPSKRRSIDGLTPEQRFFISYAQSWVQLSREERLRQLITRDSHAPDHLRAVAPLQNFQAFYDAFGIQAGAKLWLAPEKRSVIW
jgi:predicted metalloendopeptidase